MKNFLIHLSMSLGFTVNPRLWFKTKHYQLRQTNSPQELTKQDLATMIDQLVSSGELTHTQAEDIYLRLASFSDHDLKKIVIRGLDNREHLDLMDSLYDDSVDEHHDHQKDLSRAIDLFHGFMRDRIQ